MLKKYWKESIAAAVVSASLVTGIYFYQKMVESLLPPIRNNPAIIEEVVEEPKAVQEEEREYTKRSLLDPYKEAVTSKQAMYSELEEILNKFNREIFDSKQPTFIANGTKHSPDGWLNSFVYIEGTGGYWRFEFAEQVPLQYQQKFSEDECFTHSYQMNGLYNGRRLPITIRIDHNGVIDERVTRTGYNRILQMNSYRKAYIGCEKK